MTAPPEPSALLTFASGIGAMLLPALLAGTALAPYAVAIVAVVRAAPVIIAEVQHATGPALDAVRKVAPELIPHLQNLGALLHPAGGSQEQAHAAATVLFAPHRMTDEEEAAWFANASRVF